MVWPRRDQVFRGRIEKSRAGRGGRQMSVPVYEEERLGHFSPLEKYRQDKYPLGAPWGPSTSQGLYLDTDGDVLLGRADNGALPPMPCFPGKRPLPSSQGASD